MWAKSSVAATKAATLPLLLCRPSRSLSCSTKVADTAGTAALQALTELIMQHHLVPRWLLKIDDERGGRGHAYIDVAAVPAIGQALDYYSIMLSRNAGGHKPQLLQCPHYWQLTGGGEPHHRCEVQGVCPCAPKLVLQRSLPVCSQAGSLKWIPTCFPHVNPS